MDSQCDGNVVPRHIRPLHVAEIHSPQEMMKRETFDKLIERRNVMSITPPNVTTKDDLDEEESLKEYWEKYSFNLERSCYRPRLLNVHLAPMDKSLANTTSP